MNRDSPYIVLFMFQNRIIQTADVTKCLDNFYDPLISFLVWFNISIQNMHGHIIDQALLAEDKGEVVFSLLMMPQMFETQPLQEAQETLIICREISP